ncbi:MAG TPA: hypothetical protein VEK79_08400 [Thermoanaerobaculia bacterium]|nr:hypothetical protein [Thermoanaerobaculia bacterium]
MTSCLLTAALLIAVGIPIAFALPARARRWHGLLGEAYLLGAGAATFVLFLLSLTGIPWSRTTLVAGLFLVALLAALMASRRGAPRPTMPALSLANIVDGFTAALAGGHFLVATAAPPIESDYLLLWGVKARMFLAAGGIDWSYLEAPLNITAHPDYPLLLPFLYDTYAIIYGSWPEAWAGFVTFAFGLAGLLVLRNLLADEMPKLPRAIATLILMPVMFSPFIGIAEAPLITYATIGVLYVRRGIAKASRGEVVAGAVFLGLAAWSKNEGLALIFAVALGMIIARRYGLLPALLPAVAINLPWLVIHRLHGLRVDLAAGGTIERLAARLRDPLPIVEALIPRTGMPFIFWLGVTVAVAVGIRRMTADNRFLAVTTAVQFLIYAGVYFMTPRELTWHIDTSWERVLRQILPLIMLTAMLPTWSVIRFRAENQRPS